MPDSSRNKIGLLQVTVSRVDLNLLPYLAVTPELLILTLEVIFNHTISGLENSLSGTIILFQQDHLSLRVVLLEVKDIGHVGPPPTIDRLVGIPHHANILKQTRQELNQAILTMVGILVLIYMDILEFLLIELANGRILFEKSHGQQNQVVKVQGIGCLESLLIIAVDIGMNLMNIATIRS